MTEEYKPLTTAYYQEKWKEKECIKWMDDVQKDMDIRFERANGDWETYFCSKYDYLEGFIALAIYGMPDKIKGEENLIKRYPLHKRLAAAKIRRQMENVAGKSKKKIMCNQITVHVRFDDQIDGNKSDMVTVPVYRVLAANKETTKFVDWEGRVYATWDDYLKSNTLPPGMMCYYDGGFERDANNNDKFSKRDIFFSETAACGFWSTKARQANTAVAVGGTAVTVATAAVAVASYFTPVGWVATAGYLAWAAYGLSIASTCVMAYGALGAAYNIYDKTYHEQGCLSDVLYLATALIPILLNKGITRYIQQTAASGQKLSTVAKIVINGMLIGMTAMQISSFLSQLYNYATKPIITAMDVILFTISLKNATSTLISFKFAGTLLLEARADFERMEAAKEAERLVKEKQENAKKEEAKRENEKIEAEKEAKRENNEKKENGEKDTNKESDKNDKKEGNEGNEDQRPDSERNQRNERSEEDILASQRQQIQEYRKQISTEEGRAVFDQFVGTETNGRGGNELIDQNNRIIKVMREMDHNAVFNTFGATKSEIHFSNGETTELMINNNIRLHPRAMAQLMTEQRIKTETTENNNERRVTALHQYCEKTAKLDKEIRAFNENPELSVEARAANIAKAREDFIKGIQVLTTEDRFYTEPQILKLQQNVCNLLDNPQDQAVFENLTPAQAFRMNTVMKDLFSIKVKNDGMNRAKDVLAAAIELNKQCGGSPNDIYRIANMVEVVQLKVGGSNLDALPNTKDLSKSDRNTMANTLADKNSEAFKELVKTTQKGIEEWNEIVKTSEMPIGDSVAGFYHVDKHGDDEYSKFFEQNVTKPPFSELSYEERCLYYQNHLTKDLRTMIEMEKTNGSVFTNTSAPDSVTHKWTKQTPLYSQDGGSLRTVYSLDIGKVGEYDVTMNCYTSQRVDYEGNVGPRTMNSVYSTGRKTPK